MLDPASPLVQALVLVAPVLFAIAMLWPVVMLGLAILENDTRGHVTAIGDRLRRLKRRAGFGG
jgi:hypothetical protein